ncbi:glycoside hydrolase family 3 N-terminal domain-containing protein [Microbacterium sp. gxy059]|uniref:glycoside hydrolase family 3 N-terminal domain-containing protein n=1 Tax=Microbacterium sp. gxy059 TaxID=2957199 RepID=UPI003D96C529
MHRRRPLLIGVAAASVVLAGCAPSAESGEAPGAPPAESASPAPETSETPDPETRGAEEIVAEMTLRERAETVVMGYVPGTDPGAMAAGSPQALILMGDNVPDAPEALAELTARVSESASPAPLIAIDQEGGVVSRLPWDDLPSAGELQGASPSAAADAFAQRAELVADAGATISFGLVADVPRSEGSFIFERSFGTDPGAVADRVAAVVEAERGTVATTLKHFPGHGAAEGDSHEAIPSTDLDEQTWRETDAVPFQAGIDAGAELVMAGHLRFTAIDPDAPASLSSRWYEILRDELGFDGVAVTDDLGMLLSSGDKRYADLAQDAVLALAAGADLALVIAGSTPETPAQVADAIAAAVEGGELPEERLDEAATRVMQLRLDLDPEL